MEISFEPKDITKAVSQAVKTLLLVTGAGQTEADMRQAIKEAKTGQLQASQRELAEEVSPEGEAVADWAKKVQKLNNKLDKHMDASQALETTLKEHAEYFTKLSEHFLSLAEKQD